MIKKLKHSSFSKTFSNEYSDKPKADIVDIYQYLVGGKTKKTGRTTIVECCFHQEHSPSLALYPDTQSFYCFGCAKGGDIYTFVQEIKHCDFKEALQIIKNL